MTCGGGLANTVQQFSLLMLRPPPRSTLFPYTTLFRPRCRPSKSRAEAAPTRPHFRTTRGTAPTRPERSPRSEEHTSELQSPYDLVCRLLLEKKKVTVQGKAAMRGLADQQPAHGRAVLV